MNKCRLSNNKIFKRRWKLGGLWGYIKQIKDGLKDFNIKEEDYLNRESLPSALIQFLFLLLNIFAILDSILISDLEGISMHG